MDPAGLQYRPAAQADQAALAAQVCTSADPRLEAWVRNDALNRHLRSTATDDFRLLVFHEDAGPIVAVTAHERNVVVAGPDGAPVHGSYLMVAAITDRFRDAKAPDGRPLIVAVLDATFDDVRARGRGDWVSMMVHAGNGDGAGVVERLGATHVGQSGDDDVYVLHLG
ncbi:MAG: hypothetical protein ACR2NA_04655 [Solirubrobacterales bacterium]